MTKTTYTANFKDGISRTRKSDREYSHAWMKIVNDEIYDSGFSASADLAHKAVRAQAPKPVSSRDKRNGRLVQWFKDVAAEQGMDLQGYYDAAERRANSFWADAEIIIVEVERS